MLIERQVLLILRPPEHPCIDLLHETKLAGNALSVIRIPVTRCSRRELPGYTAVTNTSTYVAVNFRRDKNRGWGGRTCLSIFSLPQPQ